MRALAMPTVNYMASSIDGSSEEIIGFVTYMGKCPLKFGCSSYPAKERDWSHARRTRARECQSTVLEVDADNAAALELYASCGFVRIGESPTRYAEWWRAASSKKSRRLRWSLRKSGRASSGVSRVFHIYL